MSLSEPAQWLGYCFYTFVLLLLGCAFVVSLILIVGVVLSVTYKLVYALLGGTNQPVAERSAGGLWPRFSLVGLLALTTTVALWGAIGGQFRWQFVYGVLMLVGAMTPFAVPLVIMLSAHWMFSGSDKRRQRLEDGLQADELAQG